MAFPMAADGAVQLVDLGPGKATAINNNGAVVGQTLTAGYTGFLWQSGIRTPLAGTGTGPGSINSDGFETASDINDNGRISGTLLVGGQKRGVFWDDPGAFTEIGLLASPGTLPWSSGIGVDGAGDVAGRGTFDAPPISTFRGLLAPGGSSPVAVGDTDKPPSVGPDGYITNVQSINAAGHMFGEASGIDPGGNAELRWMLWYSPSAAGTRVNVAPTQRAGVQPPTFVWGLVGSHQIADNDSIVGHRSASDLNVYIRAANGTETGPIGTFNPLSINNDHSVVGYEYTNNQLKAVLWEHGDMTYLEDLLPPGSGWQLRVAQDINRHGDIVGMGYFQNAPHAFLLRRSLIVNDTGNAGDDDTTDKTCHTAAGYCTLRAAIEEANAQAGDQEIDFSIPGGASPTIPVPSALPSIDGSVEINGESQPGDGSVRIVGSGGNFAGLTVAGKGSRIHGIVVGGFGGDGIVLGGEGHHKLTASFVGTDASRCGGKSGAACPLGNGGAGIRVLAGDNRIGEESRPPGVVTSEGGDFDEAERNQIANNKGPGIAVMAGMHTQTHGNLNFDNGGLPVDLGGDGLTKNDALDADSGPNGLLNAPIVLGEHNTFKNLYSGGVFTNVPAKKVDYSGRGKPGALVQNAGFEDTKGCTSPYGASVRAVPIEGDTAAELIPASGQYDLQGVYPAAPDSRIIIGATDGEGNSSELSNCFDDADGDGLDDRWERDGADLDRDGKVDVRLDEMGADPKHHDVFVEFDSMKGYTFGEGSLQPVVEAFNDAPVQNLDGSRGIHLHVDMGPNSQMTGSKDWDGLGDGNVINDVQGVGKLGLDNNLDWTELRQIAEKNSDPNRRPFFHYALAAPTIDGLPKGTLGISHGIPGHDILFGLQPSCPDATPCAGPPELWPAVFMHELGHNLGLTHGGLTATTPHGNFKPNFFSVMNYLYVPTSLRTSGLPSFLDFSRVGSRSHPGPDGSVIDIDEESIDEKAGFGASGRALGNEGSWICPVSPGQRLRVRSVANLKGPQDFDCDGDESGTPKADITFDRTLEGKLSPRYELLEGTAEWDKLDVPGGIGSFFFSQVPLPPEEINDMPLPTLKAVAQAKTRDNKAPSLKLKARKVPKQKHKVKVTATAKDDRQVASISIRVDKRAVQVFSWKPESGKKKKERISCLRKAKKNRKKRARCPTVPSPKKLTSSFVVKGKGKHKISAVVYDAALRSKEARPLKLKIR